VQQIIAERRRRIVARDQRIGCQRDSRLPAICDLVMNAEEVFVVDRNRPLNSNPWPFCQTRVTGRPTLRLSDPFWSQTVSGEGTLRLDVGAIDPTEFRVKWLRAA